MSNRSGNWVFWSGVAWGATAMFLLGFAFLIGLLARVQL